MTKSVYATTRSAYDPPDSLIWLLAAYALLALLLWMHMMEVQPSQLQKPKTHSGNGLPEVRQGWRTWAS